MTDEERLRYLQLKAKSGGAPAEVEPDAPAPVRTRSTGQKVSDYVNAYGQGLTRGWADEGSSALEATLDMITGADDEIVGADGEPLSWGERRSSYLDTLKTDRDIFSRENPKTAMGLEIGGGIHGALATRKLPGTKMKLPGGPLATGTKLGRAVGSEVARAGAEGALYGAGTAEEGDALGGAVRGATTDIATNYVLKGAGKALKPLVNNRVAQDLKDKVTGMVLPLSMAGEGKLGSLYRDYVTRSPFGARKMREKGGEIAESAVRNVARKTEKTSALTNTLAGEKAAREAGAAARKTAARKAATDQYDEVVEGVDYTAGKQKGRIDVDVEDLKAQETATSQAAVAAGDSTRRVGQATKTLPPHAPQELRDFVAANDDPTAVARAIDTWWQKEGFKGIKTTQFDVDDKLESFLTRYVDEADLDELVDGGSISGGWLMDLRNNPARASGTAGDYARGKLRVDVKEFDAQMERMLKDMDTPEALAVLKEFKDELSFYGDKQAYVKAVDKAQTKRQGLFNGDDLATAGPKRPRRYGEAPGQVAGQQGQRQAAEAKTALSQTRKRADAAAAVEKKRITAEAKKAKKVAADQKDAANARAARQEAQDKRKGKLERKGASRKLTASAALAKAKKDASRLATLAGAEDTAAGFGGRVMAASTPGLLKQGARTALSATGAAKLLSSDTGSLLMAGQTNPQRLIAELLRKYDIPLEELRKGIGRYAGGQAGE